MVFAFGCSQPLAPPAAAPHAPAHAASAKLPEQPPSADTSPAQEDTTAQSLIGFVDPAALAAVRASPVVATGRLSMLFSECSGAGGIHTIFEVSPPAGGPGVRSAHGGGHGMYDLPGLTPQNSMMLAGGRAIQGDRWFVLGLRATVRPGEDRDANPDSGIKGWCLDGMPRTDSMVLASIPVPSRAAALELVRMIHVAQKP
jgi:hypothetical protein